MSTHTPGISKCQCGDAICRKYRVDAIGSDGLMSLEQARLYAAAPALLAELQSQHDKLVQELNSRIPMSERDRDRFVRIEKLIALAERGAR